MKRTILIAVIFLLTLLVVRAEDEIPKSDKEETKTEEKKSEQASKEKEEPEFEETSYAGKKIEYIIEDSLILLCDSAIATYKNLTVIANSDIHLSVDFKYDLTLPHSHRPMTLVFAKDRSEEGVKEALFSRRTVAFAGEQLMGTEDLILELFTASVQVHPPFLTKEIKGRMMSYRELENSTDLTFILEEAGEAENNERIRLNPRSIQILSYPAGKHELRYSLVNCWIGGREHPVIKID